MATITVEGNLTDELEVRVSEGGNVWVSGRLLENFSKKQADGTYEQLRPLGYDFVAFGSQAANAAESLSKGDRVRIEGSLEPNDFRKGDGEMFRGERIVATSITVSLRYATAKPVRNPKHSDNDAANEVTAADAPEASQAK